MDSRHKIMKANSASQAYPRKIEINYIYIRSFKYFFGASSYIKFVRFFLYQNYLTFKSDSNSKRIKQTSNKFRL